MLVANQKTVRTVKEEQGVHFSLSVIGLQKAMQSLKGEAFKLWMYLAKNKDDYVFSLSNVDALQWGVGSKSSYTRAIKELKEKGYLVLIQKNKYYFIENPK